MCWVQLLERPCWLAWLAGRCFPSSTPVRRASLRPRICTHAHTPNPPYDTQRHDTTHRMFTIPSLRAKDCMPREKDALNLLFLLVR